MTELKLSTSVQQDERTIRQAVQVAQALIVSTFLFLAIAVYLAITTGAWQSFAWTTVAVIAETLVFAAITLIKRGQMKAAGWTLLGLNLLGAVTGAFLYTSLGYVAAAYILITGFFIVFYVMPRDIRRPAIVVAFVGLIFTIAAEIFHPAWRQTAQLLLILSPIITTILGIVFVAVVVREAWSRSYTIGSKLLIGFSVLGFLTLLVGVIANVGSNNVRSSYNHALSDGEALRITSLELSNNLLTARRHEKDFLARWTIEGFDTAYANYAVTNQQAVTQMKGEIDALSAFAPTVGESFSATYPQSQYEADLTTLKASTNTYEQEFQKTVQLIQEKGFQDTGLEGQFRTDVHNIEDRIIGRQGLDPLVITMLTIRRHEKDYLLRGDQTYIDQTHQSVIDLKQQIASSDVLDPTEKREITALADQYVVSFDALVEKNVEIDASVQNFRDAAHTMEPIVDKLAQTGTDMRQLDVNAAETNSTQTLLFSSVTLVVALLAAAFLSVYLSRQISNPLRLLTNTAGEIAEGNFEVQADVVSSDEIGILAQTFNTMTKRLGEAFEDVRHRAAELATVAEVSTATSTILETKRLLQEVVNLTKERFNLYHSHIYLLDEKGENLVLTAGAGEPGRIMVSEGRFIPLSREQSLVARAAREQKGVTVNDVTQAPDFLPNPLLPDTHSELAVPMIVGGNVIGVFDIQSEQVGRFTDSDINIQTTLAAQLATSIQNVRSFEQSKKQADFETMVNTISQKIQRTTSIEETLQTAIRELGAALGASRVKASISGQKDGSYN